MADEVARGEPPFEVWSSENYAVSFTPSALLITNLWVPGAEGEFPADVAQAAIEDYWRFLVAQPERSVVREYRPAAVGGEVGPYPPVPGAALLTLTALEGPPVPPFGTARIRPDVVAPRGTGEAV